MSDFVLHDVLSVKATDTTGIYEVIVDATDASGVREVSPYLTRPEGTIGLNPQIRGWLAANPDFPVEPYVPPTQEGIRAAMPALSARQLRLGLLNAGIAPSQVAAAIDTMPPGLDKERAKIEWEHATTFNRPHPLISTVAEAMGLSEEQIDDMWSAAFGL